MKSVGRKVPPHSSQVFAIGAVLLILTVTLYGKVSHYEFVNIDDDVYVYDNPYVNTGLAANNAVWAFQIHGPSQWIPLTWLSHQACWQLFEEDPTGHHLVNVALHATSVWLLFGLLLRMTALVWPSALVACLFAVHPLHVESVAWVTERKDTLCGLFWMATFWMYWFYARRGGLARYALVVVSCALALMAKPLAVTLPFVLLLLDYWPLGRLRLGQHLPVRPNGEALPMQSLRWLLLEKVPLLLLSAVSSYLTVLCEIEAGALPNQPFGERLGNAAVAYVSYLGSMVWPSGLACFYPRPDRWSLWIVAAAVILLVGVTLGVLWAWRRCPPLLVGWLWYLGVLVPMSGISVAVGGYWRADRYTYLPLVGVYLMFAWGLQGLACRFPPARHAIIGILCGVLFALTVAARQQTRVWRDSQTLFEHALAVTRNNSFAHTNLANALAAKRRMPEAIEHYQCALNLNNDDSEVHTNLGNALAEMGKTREAIHHYERALQLQSDNSKAHVNLGTVLAVMGKMPEAVEHYERALQLKSDDPFAHVKLGRVLAAMGKLPEAVEQYERALELESNNPKTHVKLGIALRAMGKSQEAVEHYQRAVQLKSDYAEAHFRLGTALAGMGRMPEAAQHLEQALQLKSDYDEAHVNLGNVLTAMGRTQEAIEHYERAIELKKDSFEARNNLAWLLATREPKDGGNPDKSVTMAEQSYQSTSARKADALDTLAAAYASVGRFREAVVNAEQAIQIARSNGQLRLAQDIEARLQLYKAGRPFRE